MFLVLEYRDQQDIGNDDALQHNLILFLGGGGSEATHLYPLGCLLVGPPSTLNVEFIERFLHKIEPFLRSQIAKI